MANTVLVIITGAPASGKTTLGRHLATALHLPFVHKDGIKETLFDALGWQDRAWSRRLGQASSELLWYFTAVQLAAGRSAIIESNFDATFAMPKLLAFQAQFAFRAVQILCKAASEILLQRFHARAISGERHPGHVEAANWAEFAATSGQVQLAALPIGGHLLEVDTTDFRQVEYAAVVAWVDGMLE